MFIARSCPSLSKFLANIAAMVTGFWLQQEFKILGKILLKHQEDLKQMECVINIIHQEPWATEIFNVHTQHDMVMIKEMEDDPDLKSSEIFNVHAQHDMVMIKEMEDDPDLKSS
ncbi:hypothetical protein GYMLUDRAFT_62383 [Collybiopsis luxurians FD-317 M1]|uniref:Uncharacterized protein n=1 Tax=Collybiopsis luxurians FD-317 M1 TaxID=944289 RepID=A0A0D0C028_9AGAR|nr:hypothetical protein GYMLUDRAFT_62383 [Collybiopsis luxurians FD-317 M1]